MKCTAHSSRTGEPCRQWAVRGKSVCRTHGANAGRPPIHGRRSAIIRTFGKRIERLLHDEEILRYEPDIALFDEQEMEILVRLEEQDSPTWRLLMREAAERVNMGLNDSDLKKRERSLSEWWPVLLGLIRDGATRDMAWRDLLANRERRAAVTSQAVAAQARQERELTERELVVLLGRMVDIVEAEIGPQDARRVIRRFEQDILRVGEGEGGPATPAVN